MSSEMIESPEIDGVVADIGEVLFNIYGRIGVASSETFDQGRGHWLGVGAILAEELVALGWTRPDGLFSTPSV